MARGDRGGTARLVVAAVFVAACAAYVYLVSVGAAPSWRALFENETPAEGSAAEVDATDEEPLEPKPFADYSWEELARVSDLIEDAGAEGADAVAQEYGLENAEGTLTTESRAVQLKDGTVCQVRLVGILHDVDSATGRPVGLTFCMGAMGSAPMNESMSVDGGWEGSNLRAELSTTWFSDLPDDLSSQLVAVDKLTNNVGLTGDAESVTTTSDVLWLFSAREVCGDLDWFWHEFSDVGGVLDFAYLDDLMNLEGEQYQAFSEAGVSAHSGGDGSLAMTLKGQACTWWYRTCYPLNYADGSDLRYFYQVMESGYPESVGYANEAAGIVCGFCI